MTQFSLSYREVNPNFNSCEEWKEVKINAGGTHSTLQDFKVPEKAGGYCYENFSSNQCRNRYIYWRSNQEILELTEISLDFNLNDNNLRLTFSDSPVLAVSLDESSEHVVLLVATISSLHRILFPHPDAWKEKGSMTSKTTSEGGLSNSIFHDISTNLHRSPTNFYALDHHAMPNSMPNAAACYLSHQKNMAYFAMAFQTSLVLYVMNCDSGLTLVNQLKESHLMPRIFSNIKDALTGKTDLSDAEFTTSMTFVCLDGNVFLMALYRNDDLRMWCTKSHNCLSVINCKRINMGNTMKGPQNNCLKKINDRSICAFLSHSNGSEFVNIEVETQGNNMNLVHRKFISAPPLDLSDFDVTEERIWALWSNAEGEFSVSSYPLCSGMGLNWVSVALELPPDRYSINVEQGMDPREAYCSYIFHPGKFDQNTISKALFMFRRTSLRLDAKSLNLALLKDHVCSAIEEEIQNETKEYDVSDEDFLEISTRLWERFYTCCEQYHVKASQPIGLFVLKNLDAICLIKKTMSSLLRPCETLEHLMLAGNNVDVDVILSTQFLESEKMGEQLVHLVGVLAQLEKWLPDDIKLELDKKLYQLEKPQTLITNLSKDIISGDPDREILPKNFIVYFRQKLQSINDVREPIRLLLDNLRMDNGNPEAMKTHISVAQSSRLMLSFGSLFGSNEGLSLLSETVRQTAMIRLAICRNLLIFQQLLIDTYILPRAVVDEVRSTFYPETVKFLQAYYVMVWIAEKPINLSQTCANDSSRQRLCRFQLLNNSDRFIPPYSKLQIVSLLHMFLRAKGIHVALVLCSDHWKTLKNFTWQSTLFPLNTIISQLIWPISCNFVFGEWLFSTCQHTIIEDYVRLLNSWCEWNIASRSFILAVVLLDSSETQKAHDIFLTCTERIFNENFLKEKVLYTSPLASEFENINLDELNDDDREVVLNKGIAQYLLKIIQLFEHHNALDHVVSLAEEATGILEKDDPQVPMFQSIVFNNQLIMEHYEEAYHSMVYNSDESRKKDCLRQLVVTLFQRKRMDLLMNFPYAGLHEEFQNIVESRARSLAIEHNNIYDFLYAYYMNNSNVRKASSIMYEKAMRLQLESNSLESMTDRFHSLLICMNALHLCDPRYRWIAKPIIFDDLNKSSVEEDTLDNDEDMLKLKKEIEVIEIDDVQKEFLLTEALLTLSNHRRDIQAYLNAEAQELSFIMASCGLYTSALKLAQGCRVSLHPIFDSLTSACLRTTEESTTETLEWLQLNNLADLPNRIKAIDMAWSLLQFLVEEYEEEGSTQVRKTVVNKLLALNAFVPQWLYNSFKKDNSPELLNLYVKHSRLLEAADLAEEMIKAMLGTGSEYFSFKHSMAVTNPVMALPVHTLDVLLYGLKMNAREDIEYKKAVIDLEDLLEKYVHTALRTASDKISMAAQ